MSSVEWVNEGSKIIVWAITNHQTNGGKQMEISYGDCFKNNPPTKSIFKFLMPYNQYLMNLTSK